jgi:hypothetical protein
MEAQVQISLYARTAIKLLQGPIYAEDKALWREMKSHESQLQEYFGRIGLLLVISENDGFARIMQPESKEDEENPLPRLMRKVPLSYETTLLAVLLREMLEEFDVKSESTKLFVTQKEIKERIELFYREQSNKSKLWKDLAKPIAYLQNMGILKLTREDTVSKDSNQYEVKRIIKVIISNDKLESIKQKMDSHVNNIVQ